MAKGGGKTLERALDLLTSYSWENRREGMELLAKLGDRERALEHALRERVPAVLDVACDLLHPEPAELLAHMLGRGHDSTLFMRYAVPKGNYLHAESTIAAAFGGGRALDPDVIEAAGLAYLRSMGERLPRFLTAKLASKGREWSRESSCAIEAAVALRRLDLPCDASQVRRLLSEVDAAAGPRSALPSLTRPRLMWVLHDLGEVTLGELAAAGNRYGTPGLDTDVLADVLTGLLKRRALDEALALARAVDEDSLPTLPEGFYYWPLVDWMEANGMLTITKRDGHPAMRLFGYVRARNAGVAPPPWWSWIGRPPQKKGRHAGPGRTTKKPAGLPQTKKRRARR